MFYQLNYKCQFTVIMHKPFNKKHYKPIKLKFNSYNNYLFFGSYGLTTTHTGQLNIKQLNAIKKIILRKIKVKGNKTAKLYLRVYPIVPLTKKPVETRMGKGVGKLDQYIAIFNAQDVLFELNGTPLITVQKLILLLNGILPFQMKLISNLNYYN
jgi:large subunit ribosomal protein L16